MSVRPFVLKSDDYPRALNVLGEKITILAPASKTDGYEIFLQRGEEGAGPPPHSHAWDESFYVIRGEIEIGFDQESSVALPGTLVHLPGGTVHWFRFGKGGGEMLSMSSHAGVVPAWADIDRATEAGQPLTRELLEEVARRHGTSVGA